MIYYALVKGAGVGCDYTIGCNMRYFKLEAENLREAKEEFKNYLEDEPELGWGDAILLECSQEIKKIFLNQEWSDE
jgi:hypothetical protein